MEKKKIPYHKRRSMMNAKKDFPINKNLNAHGLPIEQGWTLVDGTPIDNLEQYITDYKSKLDKYDIFEIILGTDGLERGAAGGGREVKVLTVICLRKVGKGVHVIKRCDNQILKWDVTLYDKLRFEVMATLNTVNYLKSIGITPIVHCDLNPDPMHESNRVYNETKGMFEGMGCKVEYKPTSPAASFCADHFL